MAAEELLQRFAPSDVRNAIAWLLANGYTLTSRRGSGTFGAQFVYTGASEVVITVDRSQWLLDVSPTPGAVAWQYDLLVAAHSGQPYADALPAVAVWLREQRTAQLGEGLPEQLPEGVSWSETLPTILEWVQRDEVSAAVDQARRERYRLTWPRTRGR